VCCHERRSEIDAALVAGEPYRHIAARFGVSTTALQRHKADHLPASLVAAQEAQEAANADTLLDRLRDLLDRADSQYTLARGLVAKAVSTGDLRAATGALGAGNGAIREARACLELLAELEGELDRRPTLNLTISAEWVTLRAAMLDALTPYPDARVAVAKRLALVEANGHAGR
jgi:hypothetical protein